jgi:ABC-2 type transport system permease protein
VQAFRVFRHVLRKEATQLGRDRAMLRAMMMAPIMQVMAFGYAANTDVKHVPMVLVDQDRSSASRALVDRFTASGYFDVVGSEETTDAVEPWLVGRRADLALVIDADFGRDAVGGRRPRVQLLVDGTDSNSAVVGMGYAGRLVAEAGADIVSARSPSTATRSPAASVGRIELVPRVWYNPDLKSRWFYVPAIIAMTILLMTMILPSMAVVREKEMGTLEQLSVTPVRPWQLMVAKLLPFFGIAILDLFAVTALSVTLFHVPLTGSLAALVLLSIPFVVTALGLGLLTSTLVRSQQQAMLTSTFLFMVPMIYLSGLVFPTENMPHAIQLATYAVPLRYYAIIVRGVFLKGAGFRALWPEALVLVCFAITALTLASLRFRKSLD